ncbi:DUF948 domain-containing protein [Jeotgalibacillus proteolyticus]|uniref:DUF948 domain-containing protein n=1 Tax=Jeotgalibacillus proteolyticus TaxID=2082395 RepID=A0A2S5GBZ8_9BACL|nr:DUF948 domain-containing protein [Jeotgalibacillus proteolyticus]PPA70441.1 hypothetical protein C4B60_12775 [Jeotgalibacillus proteolyticus]
MIIKISVASASAAFVCLTAKLIQTLGTTQLTIEEVKNSLNSLTTDSKRLINSIEQTTNDIHSKINLLDPLLESAQDVGEVVHSVTDKVKQTVVFPPKQTLQSESIGPADTVWKAPVEDLPANTDVFTRDSDIPINTIISSKNGGVKIRIN